MATPRRSGRLAAKEAGRGAGAGAPGGRGAATPARARGGAKVSEAQKQWAATAGTGVAETSWFSDLSTLFLVSVCPVAVFFFHYVYTVLGGNEMALVHEIWAGGDLRAGFAAVFSKVPPQTPRAWATIGVWAAYGMASQLLVPGKEFRGPISPKGNVPVYKANGFQCYLLTLALFFGSWHQGWFNPAQVVDDLGSIFTCLNISSLLGQPHLRLLLGNRAVPPGRPARHQGVDQLPLRYDGLGDAHPVLRGQAARGDGHDL